jgi:putative radical SAM enzyme (TIGR03279 family)
MKKLCIQGVSPGTIAEDLGIEAGDFLLSINGKNIMDILDVLFLMEEEELSLSIEKTNGEFWTLEVERELHEDLGLVFEDGILDNATSCSNKCLFCFVDQLPKGMRPSLYFKDDDSRLSFLQGNFVTLTNLSDQVFQRLIEYRISPINVSVHTTNPELRIKMLKNKRAGLIGKQLLDLKRAGITMNGQIVLVPGFNDGEELTKTLMDLSELYPHMESVAIVPVGLTQFRKGLEVIRPLDQPYALQIINAVHKIQKIFLEKMDTRFVFLADEFYIQAQKPFPPHSHYEGYIQLENGVGLMKKLMTDVKRALKKYKTPQEEAFKVTVATGKLAEPFIKALCDHIESQFPQVSIQVVGIENHFFGPQITVSGLLTGGDIIRQLNGIELGRALLLPENLLKSDEDVLLDDVTVATIEETLGCVVTIVQNTGEDFAQQILNRRFK